MTEKDHDRAAGDPARDRGHMEDRSTASPASADAEALESILAGCLERIQQDGDAAIEQACAEHPGLAARIRDRIAFLIRSGLVEVGPVRGGRSVAAGAPDALPSIGPYLVEGTLGRGAMGVVYAAIDTRDGRRVALKTNSLADIDGSARSRERFLREARAAARLSHEHLVPVLDVGEASGVLYYAMEPIVGATLAHLLAELREEGRDPSGLTGGDLRAAWHRTQRREEEPHSADPHHRDAPIADPSLADPSLADPALADPALADPSLASPDPAQAVGTPVPGWGASHVEVACALVRDIARALAYAHRHGVVHRDVKPSNILVDERGRAYLFDFGLAQDEGAPALTRTGEFTGSPRYASLEQVSGRRDRIDGRTDVYSLGVTLFEALTLRAPFDADNAAELVRQIQLDEPPPLRAFTSLPTRALQTVCTTALHKELDRRYRTAADFADDLERVIAGREVLARPIGSLERLVRTARRRPVLTTLLSLVAAIVFVTPIALLRFNREIARERDQARDAAADYRREARRNAEVAGFWERLTIDLESSGDPTGQAAATELLRRALARVDAAIEDSPLSRAILLETIAQVHRRLGRNDVALPLLDRALTLRTSSLGADHEEVAASLILLAETHAALGTSSSAVELADRADEMLARLVTPFASLRARLARARGDAALAAGDAPGASDHYRRSIESFSGQDDEEEVATTIGRLADALFAGGDAVGAELARRDSVERLRALPRPPLGQIADSLASLASLCLGRGDLGRAREYFDAAIHLQRKIHGDHDPMVMKAVEAALEAEGGADPDDVHAARRVGRLCILLADNMAWAGMTERVPTAHAWLDRGERLLSAGGAVDERAVASVRARLADAVLPRAGAANESPSAFALNRAFPLRQGDEDQLSRYDATFQKGITALQAGRAADAVLLFDECLTIIPGVPVCSYNTACAQVSLADHDRALAALERACEDGLGFRPSDVELLERDTDLDPLRELPRFRSLLQRVRERAEEARVRASRPLIYAPADLDPTVAHPALVVLHRHDAEPRAIVEGAWREVADRRGMILIAPAGPYPVTGGSDRALTWVEDLERFRRRPWHDERTIGDALREARGQHKIDPARVILAGIGLGGILAFDMALRAPDSFAGVLLVDATIDDALARDRAANLGRLGLRAALLGSPTADVEGLLHAQRAPQHGELLARRLGEYRIDVCLVDWDATTDRIPDAVEAAIAALLEE